MDRKRKLLVGGAAIAAVLLGGAGVAVAASRADDDAETQITGDALDRAEAAALAHTGGGRVTETEVGDEESRYEVEVTLDDGTQVDVQLDDDFEVVGSSRDLGSRDDD